MRIAMLGHKRTPSREGGVEVVVEELATRMAALGHEVTVYSRKGHNVAGAEFDDPMFDQDEYTYKGVRVKQIPTLDIKGLAALISSYYATKAAIADEPDIIHFHAEGPCAMLGMAKKAGIRTVATIHGLDWQRAKWGKFGRAFIKHGEKVAAKKADEIIVLSNNVRDYFAHLYGRDVEFIPNGISQKKTVPASLIKERYGLDKSSYVLYLGRMVPEKGVHYLIEAFRGLETEKRLVLAGGSSDSERYFDGLKAEAEDDHRIVFTGFTTGRELDELFSNAALYVLPSDLEGMPMSLLEAMAYGLCCLTSDIPECSDVLAGHGFTFPRGNVAALRDALNLLLASERTESVGEAARAHVLSKYDWDSVVKRTLKLYDGNGR